MALRLHVLWARQRLYLWGERSAGLTGSDDRGGPVDAPTLRAALGEASPDSLLAASADEGELDLWMPCDDRGPIGSAVACEPGNGSDVATLIVGELRVVRVEALAFSAVQAVDLLTSWPADLPTSCAESIRYWAELSRFVMSLLARRQFVPNLEETDEGFFGRWRPVVQDREELDWLERWAAAMPAVCRAAVGGEPDPSRVVESFLAATADGLIRRCVSEDPFFRQPAERQANESLSPEMRPRETRWLAALLEHEPKVADDGEDENINGPLAQTVQSWVGQLEPSVAASTMRLLFRLEEPVEPEEAPDGDGNLTPSTDEAEDWSTPTGPWTIQLQLESESADEPPMDAKELWGDGGAAVLLGRGQKNRQARLLSELARAAQIYPALQPLLQQATPASVELSSTDAFAFIRQWAPILREQAFGVVLPGWAERSESELGLRLQVRPMDDTAAMLSEDDWDLSSPSSGRGGTGSQPMEMPSGHFGLDALLQFDWQIAVGNLRLSTQEFQRLASSKTPLVKLRGQWVQIDLDAAAKAAQFLQQQQDKPLTLVDALRTAYGTSRAETGLPVLGLGGTSWVEQLLEQAPGVKVETHGQPKTFHGTLRPYQLRGLHWMAFLDRLGIGACLADDMGLGKTIQLISLLLHEQERFAAWRDAAAARNGNGNGNGSAVHTIQKPGPTLLFAPTSVVGNWVRELQRFCPEMKVLIHHGPDRLAGDAFKEGAVGSDVVITSYALAHRDRDDLKSVSWWRVVLDEAQKIKNPAAASTMAIRALPAGRRVALTGTPIENHLSELWSIMEVLNPGLLGAAGEFREKFAVPIEKLGDRERSEQLRRLIKPFVLRRLKTDPEIAGDLPEKMESKVFCNLTPEQAAQYERLVGQSLSQIDAATGIRRRGLILSVLTRLKQVCDHPALILKEDGPLDGRSGKAERLIEMLEECFSEGEGDAALVFTQFREMGHLLERMIAQRLGAKVQFLHGGTPAKERDAMIERFQAPGSEVKVFLLSLRAGGLGLNLTAANHVFHYDRWWNPAVESQATDRAHRVGQTRKVQVHKFVCIGTMEERIDRLLTEKLALADKIIGSGDEWLTNMSTDQLREYLALSKEAVGDF